MGDRIFQNILERILKEGQLSSPKGLNLSDEDYKFMIANELVTLRQVAGKDIPYSLTPAGIKLTKLVFDRSYGIIGGCKFAWKKFRNGDHLEDLEILAIHAQVKASLNYLQDNLPHSVMALQFAQDDHRVLENIVDARGI